MRWFVLGFVVLAALVAVASGTTGASGATVLWDTSHGVYLNYEPAGRYSELVTLLAANSIALHTTSDGFLVDSPNGYDAIVVCNPSSYNTAYGSAEVSVIRDYVSSGGGLLIMADNTNTRNANIQPVASAFGVTVGVSDIVPLDTYTTVLAPHAIFDGISEIYMRAAGEIESSSPLAEVAWQSGTGKELVAAGYYGLGSVVVMGDSNTFDNGSQYLGAVDNTPFALNTFEYITSAVIPEPSTLLVWSLLAALGIGWGAYRRKR